MSKKVDKYILVDGKHGRHDSKGNLVIYRAGVKGQNMLTLTKAEARALGNKVKSLAAVRAELAVFDEEEETEDILEKEVGPEGSTKMQGVDDEEDDEDEDSDEDDSDDEEDEEEEWDFSDMTGPDSITIINSLSNVKDLEAALESEKEGKNRVTVINAINHRIEVLEDEEEEEEDEDEG